MSSMSKYGAPVKCEICQQTCAFNRNDLRIDGKLHCWLCKLSYKRALAKAKKSDHRDRTKKRSAEDGPIKTGSSMKLSNQSSSNRNNNSNSSQRDMSKANLSDIPEKISKTSNSVIAPSHSSDHVVALTQLREQIATLQKKLQQKDNQLLQKDKEVSFIQNPLFFFFRNMFFFLSCFFKLVNLLIKCSKHDFIRKNLMSILIFHPCYYVIIFTLNFTRSLNGKENILQLKPK